MESPKTTTHALRMSYRIGRGEQGVLSFEPYKSTLLPLWRFRTVEIARKSSQDLWERFEKYDEEGDFVGMDMCRKFIQMVFSAPHRRQSWIDIDILQGMTRAKRYANHRGGRKYAAHDGKELPKSSTHKDAKEKMEASDVFRQVWNRCREHEGYQRRKAEFLKDQREWDKSRKKDG